MKQGAWSHHLKGGITWSWDSEQLWSLEGPPLRIREQQV